MKMMKTRNLFFALVVGLTLATVPMVGCGGDTDDPSGNNNTGKTDTGGGGKEDVGGGKEDVGGGKEDVGGNEEKDVGGNEEKDVEESGECEVDTLFQGQIGGTKAHEGGTLSTENYTNDAGIQAVIDATDKKVTHDPPLKIENARVVATTFDKYANETFWIQDMNAGVQLYKLADQNTTIKVGQAVSFDVVESNLYRGHVQISKIANLEVTEETGPVYLQDKAVGEIGAEQYMKMVRVAGRLSDQVDCGSPTATTPTYCYSFTSGEDSILFRSNSNSRKNGDCVTYVGPLGADLGPKDDKAPDPLLYQADAVNHDWQRGPWVDL